MRVRRKLALLFAAALLVSSMGATPVQTVRVFFGNPDAHSELSVGGNTPAAGAYDMARGEGGLDFLSLSEHSHLMDNADVGQLKAAAAAGTTGQFIALSGQEFSYCDSPLNHTNIHNLPFRIYKSNNGSYRYVFGQLIRNYMANNPDVPIIAGFSHPRRPDRDYGFEGSFDEDWERFAEAMDPIVQLIAIANGPADTGAKSCRPTGNKRLAHRKIGTAEVNDSFEYLSRAMYLGPQADHDTHSKPHGIRVATRTGVWIRGPLSKNALLSALAAGHTYATEDLNLWIFPALPDSTLPGDIIENPAGNSVAATLRIQLNKSKIAKARADLDQLGRDGVTGHDERGSVK